MQHIGLQILDAGLKVNLPVLKPRLLQQRLLVLQVPTLPVPPVTNKKNQQLITYETAYSANYNQEKPILKNKNLPQTTAHQDN